MTSFFLEVQTTREATMRGERPVVAGRKRLNQYCEQWHRIHPYKKLVAFALVCDRMGASLSLGPPVYSSLGSGTEARGKNPANDASSQIEFVATRWATYVCFRLTATVSLCAERNIREINTALQYVNRARSTVERARLNEGRQRLGAKGKSKTRSAHPRENGPLNSYLLSQDVRTDEHRFPIGPRPSMAKWKRCA